jgi:hypothetical protein
MDEMGCDEIYDGDEIFASEIQDGPWTFKKYTYNRF